MSKEDRKRWGEVMELDYMSSEDSDGAENEVKVRHIPWLSENVQKFKQLLDEERLKSMSSQSKRQMKKKTLQGISQRQKPSRGKPWMYKKPAETV